MTSWLCLSSLSKHHAIPALLFCNSHSTFALQLKTLSLLRGQHVRFQKIAFPATQKFFRLHFFDHVASVEAGGLEIFRETRFLRQQCRFQADNDPSDGYLTIPCFIVSRNPGARRCHNRGKRLSENLSSATADFGQLEITDIPS